MQKKSCLNIVQIALLEKDAQHSELAYAVFLKLSAVKPAHATIFLGTCCPADEICYPPSRPELWLTNQPSPIYKSSACQLVKTTHNYWSIHRNTTGVIVQSVTQYCGCGFNSIKIYPYFSWIMKRFLTLNSTVQCFGDSEIPGHTSQATVEQWIKNAKYRKYSGYGFTCLEVWRS